MKAFVEKVRFSSLALASRDVGLTSAMIEWRTKKSRDLVDKAEECGFDILVCSLLCL